MSIGARLRWVQTASNQEMQIFQAGLKHVPALHRRLQGHNHEYMRDHHDHMDYERGAICHARNSFNQYWNFHTFFGGAFNQFHRYFVQHFWRRGVRIAWLPLLASWCFYGWTMRCYDTEAYDFYYFSD